VEAPAQDAVDVMATGLEAAVAQDENAITKENPDGGYPEVPDDVFDLDRATAVDHGAARRLDREAGAAQPRPTGPTQGAARMQATSGKPQELSTAEAAYLANF
jgi:hypothetical protein